MKAEFTNPQLNSLKYGEKELTAAYTVIGIGKSRSDVDELASLRIYMGRSRTASRVYASLWVRGKGINCAGSGWAGGYGYHKASAATSEAFANAGITLDESISACGDRAICDALHALGLALGYDTVRVITA